MLKAKHCVALNVNESHWFMVVLSKKHWLSYEGKFASEAIHCMNPNWEGFCRGFTNDPRCHFPRKKVNHPFWLSVLAMLGAFSCIGYLATYGGALLARPMGGRSSEFAPATQSLVGARPVKIWARDGEQVTPACSVVMRIELGSEAKASMLGVGMGPPL